MPKISIITPVYNAEKTLDRCVQSVLRQRFTDYELLLIDDGSIDNSGKMCDDYAENAVNIRVIHTENCGVSTARNTGIAYAHGAYLLFLDSDDALEDDALGVYDAVTEQDVYDVVIGTLLKIEKDRPLETIGVNRVSQAGSEIWETICKDCTPFGYAPGKLIRASIIRDHGIRFNTKMRSQEDLDFFLSAYAFCSHFYIIQDPYYRYYYSPGKRTPPFWDFLANQLKLLRIAQEKVHLSDDARGQVYSRILLLLYTGLHDASTGGDFHGAVTQLENVAGLADVLRDIPKHGERGFVAKCFIAGRYRFIQTYFILRGWLRKILRRPQSAIF